MEYIFDNSLISLFNDFSEIPQLKSLSRLIQISLIKAVISTF